MQSLKRKEVNFISASKRKDKKKQNAKGSKVLLILLPVFLFLAVAGTIGYFYYEIVTYNTLTAEEMGYLESPQLAQQKADMEQLQSEIDSLKKQKDIVDRTNLVLHSMTEIDQADMEAVLDAREGAVTITDISYSGGVLMITAKGMTYTDPPLYAQRLEATGVFAYVDYTGFMEEVTEAGSSYTFTVAATLQNAEVTANEE